MTVICVAGMHRSGTSMVTRILNLGGVSLGEDENLLLAGPDNEKGFWENLDFVQMNDKILAKFNGAWDLPPVLEEGWEKSPELTGLYENARFKIKEMETARAWAWKDPRNSLTLPFWKQLIPNMKVIVSFRYPQEVALSLSKRNHSSMQLGYNLWKTYNEQLISTIFSDDYLVTHYSSFFIDPYKEIERIFNFVGMPISDKDIQTAVASIKPIARHHCSIGDDIFWTNPQLNKVKEIYTRLCLEAGSVYWMNELSEKKGTSLVKKEELLVQLIEKRHETQLIMSQLAERDAQLAERDTELHEIKISKAWRLVMRIRKLRVLLVPPNSLRARLVRKIYGFFFRNKVFYYSRRAFSVLFQDGVRAVYRLVKNKLTLFFWKLRIKSKKKMGSPDVSVVIPIYDRTDILIESIESILKQTYKKFELLLVCDGSPKETLKIVQKYEAQNSKVRAFYFKNNSGNAVHGRNKAIKEARGTYLAFHDSDDIAEPDRLAVSIKFMEQYDVDVVYGGWRALLDGTRIDVDVKNKQEVYSPDCDFEMLKEICVPCQSTVMAKVDALREVGGLNEKMRYREDHELWLRLAHKGYRFKSIPKVLTNLRLHQNNLELSLKKDDDFWFNLMLDEYDKERSMKPKIGYVIPGTGIGGGILVVCEHVNRLILRGYDVTILTEDDHDEIPWYPNLLSEVVPVYKAQRNYDILIATGWTTAYAVRELPAKRKMYLVQSDERRFYSKDDPNVLEAENTYKMEFEFLTVARWMQNWLKEEFGKEAVYVQNSLNKEFIFQTTPIIPKGKKVRVLLEGPIDIPFKGMDDAFRAVDGLDCETWCVSSSGKPKPEWKYEHFFEKVPWNEMKNIYSSCDILLKMSRVESFCYPPLEMMACGGTAVIGEVTGLEEYAVDGYNALIVGVGDVQGARAALSKLIVDKKLRSELIENGKKTVEKFDWEPTIDVLENVFNQKLGEG